MIAVTIDRSNIPADLLTAELEAAKSDPDGQVYPWRPLYPLAGQTVYCDGKLWTVGAVSGPDYSAQMRGELSSQRDIVRLHLIGEVHTTSLAYRGELRPVTWTQADETRVSK
jgi:hypothetical protein